MCLHISSCITEVNVKKTLLILSILLISSSLYAVTTGYTIAPVGEKPANGDSFGAMSFSYILSPTEDRHIGDIEAEALLSIEAPYLMGVNLKVSSPLFATVNHPFGFLFANATLWAPKLSAGVQYRINDGVDLYLGLAPFNFQDTSFVYEFLSPYALYDLEDKSWGYGAYVMRFIYFF